MFSKIFYYFNPSLQESIIKKSVEVLLEVEEKTTDFDIANSIRNELKSLLIAYLKRSLLSGDMVEICVRYLTTKDLDDLMNQPYNYNKLHLLIKSD